MTTQPDTSQPAAVIPPLPPGGLRPQDDYVDGPSSTTLAGAVIEYTYTRGNHYKLSFDHGGRVTFELLNLDGPPPPLLPYRARDLRPGQVLVHWIVKPASIHVSLVIDLEQRTVAVGAMMPPNQWEFFDTAKIIDVEFRPAP